MPEHLQQSLCSVMNQLAVDAPTGDIEFEEESLTPARYEEYLEVFRQQGRARLTTVAVHRRRATSSPTPISCCRPAHPE